MEPGGAVVARGRNRVYDRKQPREALAWSLLAHAEVDALAKLSPERRYEDHVLLTALEPCVLCVGATRLATVGGVHYAGSDPYGGAAHLDLADLNPMLARLDVETSGPMLGPLGTFFTVLQAEFFLRRRPGGFVVAAYRRAEPSLVAAAETLRSLDVAERARRAEPLESVLRDAWPVIASET